MQADLSKKISFSSTKLSTESVDSVYMAFAYEINSFCVAPEVVSMEPYGHAVDWWSLGVVACCMLSGQVGS